MSNEIEIGEYVRTSNGLIGKIKRIDFDEIDKSLKWYVFNHKEPNINIVKEVYINKPYIAKHSKDITELIETKDILKIKEDNSTVYVGLEKDEQTVTYKDIIDDIKNGKIELLEILTHEQFENNSYKVGV